MTSRNMADCQYAEVQVIDPDTLRYGGSNFVREKTCHAISDDENSDPYRYFLWVCSECGQLINKNDNYCFNCGAKVIKGSN